MNGYSCLQRRDSKPVVGCCRGTSPCLLGVVEVLNVLPSSSSASHCIGGSAKRRVHLLESQKVLLTKTSFALISLNPMSDICFEIDPSDRLLRGGQTCLKQVKFLPADPYSLQLGSLGIGERRDGSRSLPFGV